MEILTRHHNKDMTVKFESGRELRVPKVVVEALTNAGNVGIIERIYKRNFADFLIGGIHDGAFEMEAQWTEQWNEHGMFGDFRPFVNGRELSELTEFLNSRFGRGEKFPGDSIRQIARGNVVRPSLPFVRFRQRRGEGRLYEVDVRTVLGD